MLKRSKKILLLALGVLLISGCKLKSEVTMDISDDKSMIIKYVAGYDDELINAMMSMNESSSLEEVNGVKEYTDEEQRKFLNENLFKDDESFASLEAEGFVVEEYQDETYMGYSMTKNIDNIDDFVGETTDFSLANYENFNSKKIFTKNVNVYKGRILFEDTENEEAAETYGVDLEYIFTLTLPNKAVSSNATTVSDDGKTLTWNLVNSDVDAIEFEFEFPSFLSMIKDNMFIVAGIVVAIVLIIVVITTLIIMKSRNGKKNNSNKGLNVETAVVDTQPEIQSVMSQNSIVIAQPEMQPVIPESPVVSAQLEIQSVMPQNPIISVQPEVQPEMPQDTVVSLQQEIKPIPQEPIVITDLETQLIQTEETNNSQPLFPQDIVPPKDYNQ